VRLGTVRLWRGRRETEEDVGDEPLDCALNTWRSLNYQTQLLPYLMMQIFLAKLPRADLPLSHIRAAQIT
jgi:hypothetical protein